MARVPDLADRLQLELEQVRLAHVAQGPAVADHRVRLLGLEALAALEAAELVAAEVDRPVGDRPRREGGGERGQRLGHPLDEARRCRRAPAAARGWTPSSASTTISSARSRPTPSTSRFATRSSWEGSERLTQQLGADRPPVPQPVPQPDRPPAGANSRAPSVTAPLAGIDGDDLAVAQDLGRIGGADHAGDAELAGDDRGVAGHPSGVGDDRRRPAHQRHPVGGGHVGDENLALLQLRRRRRSPTTRRTVPHAAPGAAPRPRTRIAPSAAFSAS